MTNKSAAKLFLFLFSKMSENALASTNQKIFLKSDFVTKTIFEIHFQNEKKCDFERVLSIFTVLQNSHKMDLGAPTNAAKRVKHSQDVDFGNLI